jgi:hypothetical protein
VHRLWCRQVGVCSGRLHLVQQREGRIVLHAAAMNRRPSARTQRESPTWCRPDTKPVRAGARGHLLRGFKGLECVRKDAAKTMTRQPCER